MANDIKLGVSQDTCHNSALDGDESDVDCGGGCPAKCQLNKKCRTRADCVSGLFCLGGVCVVSTVCFGRRGICSSLQPAFRVAGAPNSAALAIVRGSRPTSHLALPFCPRHRTPAATVPRMAMRQTSTAGAAAQLNVH